MHKLVFIFSASLLWNVCHSQNASIPAAGPISLGLGGTRAAISNHWAIFNNPAGLGDLQGISGIFGYQTIINFTPFNSVLAALNAQIPFGNTAFGVYKFGDDLFSTQMASLGFARKLGIMSLGIKANLLQYDIAGFGKRSVFLGEMGGIANLTPLLNFGIHIYNFTQSVIAQETQEKVPILIRMAINYQISNELQLFIEGEKDVEREAEISLGLSFQFIEALQLRTGFATQTNRYSFGAGLKIQKFIVDYAVSPDSGIGTTHNFGLTYQFGNG